MRQFRNDREEEPNAETILLKQTNKSKSRQQTGEIETQDKHN